MVLRRRLVARKGQVLVSVPIEVRQQLGVEPGETVYWQITNRGSAVLSRTSRAPAGRPVDPDLTRALRERDRLVQRLRSRVQARPVRVYNEGYNQGRTAHMGELVKLSVKIDGMREDFERVESEVLKLRAQLPLRRVPRPARPQSPRAVDEVHLPEPVIVDVPCTSCGRLLAEHSTLEREECARRIMEATFRGDTEIAPPS